MNSILELLEAGWRLVSARGLGGMGSDLAMGLQAFSSRGLSLVLARVLREVRRLGRLDGAWSSPSLSLDIWRGGGGGGGGEVEHRRLRTRI